MHRTLTSVWPCTQVTRPSASLDPLPAEVRARIILRPGSATFQATGSREIIADLEAMVRAGTLTQLTVPAGTEVLVHSLREGSVRTQIGGLALQACFPETIVDRPRTTAPAIISSDSRTSRSFVEDCSVPPVTSSAHVVPHSCSGIGVAMVATCSPHRLLDAKALASTLAGNYHSVLNDLLRNELGISYGANHGFFVWPSGPEWTVMIVATALLNPEADLSRFFKPSEVLAEVIDRLFLPGACERGVRKMGQELVGSTTDPFALAENAALFGHDPWLLDADPAVPTILANSIVFTSQEIK